MKYIVIYSYDITTILSDWTLEGKIHNLKWKDNKSGEKVKLILSCFQNNASLI